MSHLLDDDDDLGAPRDRELTLSTGAILGIFFGLVLLCGVFFAFGYSVGRHKTAPAEAETTEGGTTSPSANFGTFKPAAGSPAGSAPATVTAPASTAPAVVQARPATTPYTPSSPAPAAPSHVTLQPTPAPVVRQAPVSAPPAATAEPSGSVGANGFFMVQVAAVSHKEDADLLLSALRSRGYTVMSRTYIADPLIHIQVGPFSTRKDAETMRSKLLGDGYNAIVK